MNRTFSSEPYPQRRGATQPLAPLLHHTHYRHTYSCSHILSSLGLVREPHFLASLATGL